MHQQQRSAVHHAARRRRRALRTVTLAVLVGASPVAAQPPAPHSNHQPATRPFRKPPPLLSDAEVAKGLTARHQAMRERFLVHQARRRQHSAEDYSVVEPPATTPGHARPDAPGGEFHAGGLR